MSKFVQGDEVRIVSREQMLDFAEDRACTDEEYCGRTPAGLFVVHQMFVNAGREATVKAVVDTGRYRLYEYGYTWDEYLLESPEQAGIDYEALSQSLSDSLISLLCPKEGCP